MEFNVKKFIILRKGLIDMCQECMRTPCHPRCPNADIPVLYHCENCDCEIFEGDTIYKIDGAVYCEDCIYEFKTYAERGDYDE